jgi:hypothetical protein
MTHQQFELDVTSTTRHRAAKGASRTGHACVLVQAGLLGQQGCFGRCAQVGLHWKRDISEMLTSKTGRSGPFLGICTRPASLCEVFC